MKRYDFDWGYVGIEQREDEYGDWVRYEDALAYYSKELDHAYAEGRKDEREQCANECREIADALVREGEGCRDGRYDWMVCGALECFNELNKAAGAETSTNKGGQ